MIESTPAPASRSDTPQQQTVVVGLDGSLESERALSWTRSHLERDPAIGQPDQRSRAGLIQPVVVWHTPWWATSPPAPGAPPPPSREVFEASARELAEKAMEDTPSDQRLDSVVINGHAGRVLCNVADRADLLVVGSRGRGAVAETLLGSTGAYCAAHAAVPVVIVPPTVDPMAEPDRVIVGIDGSNSSVAALTWALDNIGDRTPIVAVLAYTPAGTPFETIEDHDREGILTARARDTLDLAVRRAVRHAGGRQSDQDAETRSRNDRRITATTVVADPRHALIGSPGDLVVVGARGHRGIAHLLVGSTTTALIHHLTTTTVIVPAGR